MFHVLNFIACPMHLTVYDYLQNDLTGDFVIVTTVLSVVIKTITKLLLKLLQNCHNNGVGVLYIIMKILHD